MQKSSGMTNEPRIPPAFASSELGASVALLATMGDLCSQVLRHIVADNLRAVFPLNDQLRQIRSAFADLLASKVDSLKDFQPATPAEVLQLAQLRLGVQIVGTFDRAHAEWSRGLADPGCTDAAYATVLDWHASLEKRLPSRWDLKRDLLVVVGLPPEELILAIEERGQQRVMVFPVPASPPSAIASPEWEVNSALQASSLEREDSKEDMKLLAAAFAAGRLRRVDSVTQAKENYFLLDPPRFYEIMVVDPCIETDFHDAVKRELESLHMIAIVGQNTMRVFGPRWFNQGLDNLPTIANSRPLAELVGKYAGVPAVLISPGPSLDRNIGHLKTLQGKALLLAPGQSIKRLHKEGIYPDFVAVIDPQDLTSPPTPFFDAELIRDHQALLAGVTCHPNVLRLPYRRKYVFGSSSSAAWIDAIFGDAYVNIAGSSVSVAALNMLIDWGCNPIVLVGQDLAFSDGKQYAGATDDKPGAAKPARVVPHAVFEVEGYYGGTVFTPYGYKAALFEMEVIAERLASRSGAPAVVNATEGGANIRGFAKQPLAEVVKDWKEYPELIPPLWPTDTRDAPTQRLRRAYGQSQLQKINEVIAEVNLQVHACFSLCERIQKRPNKRLLDRLSKQEKKMRSRLRPLAFVSLAVQEEIEGIQKSLGKQNTLEDNLKASVALYQTILAVCNITRDKVSTALEAIDAFDMVDGGKADPT
jgi:hypothetical protein